MKGAPYFRVLDVKVLLEPHYWGVVFGNDQNTAYQRWAHIRDEKDQRVSFDTVDKLVCFIGRPDLMVHLEPV